MHCSEIALIAPLTISAPSLVIFTRPLASSSCGKVHQEAQSIHKPLHDVDLDILCTPKQYMYIQPHF